MCLRGLPVNALQVKTLGHTRLPRRVVCRHCVLAWLQPG
jgi:hypothetical protein